MEAIRQLIGDPGWWFTVVVAGLVIAILGNVATKWVTTLSLTVTGKLGLFFRERQRRREQLIQRLVDDPVQLTWAIVDAAKWQILYWLIGVGLSWTFSLLVPILKIGTHVGVDVSELAMPQLPNWLSVIIVALGAFGLIWLANRAVRGHVITHEARKRYVRLRPPPTQRIEPSGFGPTSSTKGTP